ncbi:MAG: enoyl-CoA hydratase-related protein [Actinomycetota bacterium]
MADYAPRETACLGPTSRTGSGVRVTARGPIRIVTLDRPGSLNAVDRQMHSDLALVWRRLEADRAARAVVLTGSGEAFCGGGDLQMITAVADDVGLRDALMSEAREIIVSMLEFPLPVVAAINGPAVGLGCSLAMLCDVVLMAEHAYLADPHVALGLVAGDGGAAMWPLLASPLKIKELLWCGDRIPAVEAERIGLATRVVPKDTLAGEAMRVAERLADLPARAVQDTKRAVNLHLTRSAAGALDFALAAETVSMGDPDHRERLRHLVQRHPC